MPSQTIDIPPEKIHPNPQQPRTHFDEDELALLGRSLVEHQQIQPIVVEEAADGCGYILIAGERRWRAAQAVGLAALKAVVRPPSNGSGDRDRLLLAMVENLQRAEMGPVDVARGWQALIEKHGYDVDRIAKEFGRNPVTVENHLGWLALEPEILDLVNRGALPRDARARKALMGIPDSEARIKLAGQAAEKRVTLAGIVRACRILAEQLERAEQPSADEEPTPALRFTKTDRKRRPRGWGALQEAGQAPSWPFVVASIDAACNACSWSDLASPEVCRDCPVVSLVRRLAGPCTSGQSSPGGA